MADYTRSELLNEVAKLFRARIEAVKEGGTLNTREEYEQLKEVTSIALVMNPEAIFYIAFLASNRLAATVSREVAFVEDMLVSLGDLDQIARGVPDTTDISNATTTLLALDAAVSVKGRPEVKRFSDLMDKVASSYQPNLINRRRPGRVIQPREEAQKVIRSDLAQLKVIHDRMLVALYALRDILIVFDELDVPSAVSNNVFTSVRTTLDDLSADVESNTTTESVAASRRSALTVMASKVAVNLLADFRDPGEVKLRSPTNPIPPTLRHKGQATGEGTPATVLSGFGPWKLPIVDPFEIKVDGGSLQSVPLEDVVGVALNGTAPEPFSIGVGARDLNVLVDPEQYEGTTDLANSLLSPVITVLNEVVPLNFKHLGTIVSYPEADADGSGAGDPNNMYHRALVAMPRLQEFPSATYSPTTKLLTVTLPGIPDASAPYDLESNVGFVDDHVGMYIIDGSSNIFEVTERVSATACFIDARGQAVDVGGAVSLHGQRVTTWNPNLPVADRSPTQFIVSPALNKPPNGVGGATSEKVILGPTIKNARLTATTAAGVVSEINSLAANAAEPGQVGVDLGLHALATTVAGDATRVALQPRSRLSPFLKIDITFLKPLVASPGPMEIVVESASVTLGLPVGASIEGTGFDTNDVVSPAELVGLINDGISGATAEVDNATVFSGTEMSTIDGMKKVRDTTVDFIALGIKAGHVLELLSGAESGTYTVTNVATTELTLDKLENFSSNAGGRSYNILRLGVRVSSNSNSTSSSLEVLGPAEFGFPTSVQYGTMTRFEAVAPNGDLLSFTSLVVEQDTLRLVGIGSFTILEVLDTQLELSPGFPSNTKDIGFEVLSQAAEDFNALQKTLVTYTESGSLLKKNKFDEGLDVLDAALTSVLLQGQNFASARGRARQILLDLLSILTDSPKRQDEWQQVFEPAAITLLEEVQTFLTPPIRAVDSAVASFRERKYDRAVDLLIRGQLEEFYDTNEETGSYGGAMIAASREAVRDLPVAPSSQPDVENSINLATGTVDGPDPEEDFDDYDESLEIDL